MAQETSYRQGGCLAELPKGSGLGDAVESLLAYRLRFACGHYYSHSPQDFAGVKDGYVAIYYGSPRQDAPLKQLTAVRIELLPKDFQASLKRGVPIRDDYALMLFLEGIES